MSEERKVVYIGKVKQGDETTLAYRNESEDELEVDVSVSKGDEPLTEVDLREIEEGIKDIEAGNMIGVDELRRNLGIEKEKDDGCS